MGIIIFTKKQPALNKVFPKNTEFISEAMSKKNTQGGEISYIDVSGFTTAKITAAISQAKKICKGTSWGIIDPQGSVKDPASLFLEGASDYLGPNFFKGSKPIDPKRLKAASKWRLANTGGKTEKTKEPVPPALTLPKTGIKVPSASLFPGWKKMQEGKTLPFYTIYCSLHGKTSLATRLGEKAYGFVQQRVLTHLFQSFRDADGLIWMQSNKDFLFLLPPKTKNAETAVKTCVRILASAPLIAMEVLGLTVPVNFVFALHYGPIRYSPPGKTGTVVSDAVNFIFHLGGKKAEPGRLTISNELPDASIPKALEDCFVSAGMFEGKKIWHTKKFSYVKPWF